MNTSICPFDLAEIENTATVAWNDAFDDKTPAMAGDAAKTAIEDWLVEHNVQQPNLSLWRDELFQRWRNN